MLRHLTFVRCICIAMEKKRKKWHVLNSNYAKMPEYFSEDILLVNTSMQTVQIQDRSHIVHVQNQNK